MACGVVFSVTNKGGRGDRKGGVKMMNRNVK